MTRASRQFAITGSFNQPKYHDGCTCNKGAANYSVARIGVHACCQLSVVQVLIVFHV